MLNTRTEDTIDRYINNMTKKEMPWSEWFFLSYSSCRLLMMQY